MFRYIDDRTNSLFGIQDSINILDSRLDDETKQDIFNNNICLIASTGPGTLFENTHGVVENLIVIDMTLVSDLLRLTPHEISALILHEVGHKLNRAPTDQSALKEFYADDYARSKGFGVHLKEGLKRYVAVIDSHTNNTRCFFRSLERQEQILASLNSRISRI